MGVGVNTILKSLGEKEEISSADIRKELFEGENIRTKKWDKEHPERMHSGGKELIKNRENQKIIIEDTEDED